MDISQLGHNNLITSVYKILNYFSNYFDIPEQLDDCDISIDNDIAMTHKCICVRKKICINSWK